VATEESTNRHSIAGGQLSREPEGCPFCSLPKQRIVAETPHFVLVRPLVPILGAEVLVIPRHHAGALALLSQLERDEVDFILEFVLARLRDHQSGVAFEHGNHSRPPAEPWHEHAHLHIMACPVDASSLCCFPTLAQHFGTFGACPSIAPEYVFCTDWRSHPTFLLPSEPLPMGFLRNTCNRLLAQCPRKPDKDFWRVIEAAMSAAIEQLPSFQRSDTPSAKENT
jgi:diadenosine tetraphosphate (Ap4A) HIT family hydrolase